MANIWQDIFSSALKNGLWAVLFVLLLFYQLKDSKDREKKYQTTIEKLSTSVNFVKSINENVLILKNSINDMTIKIVKIEKLVKKTNKLAGLIFNQKPSDLGDNKVAEKTILTTKSYNVKTKNIKRSGKSVTETNVADDLILAFVKK